jgi:hypothetical protein
VLSYETRNSNYLFTLYVKSIRKIYIKIKLWTQYGYKTLNPKHCTSLFYVVFVLTNKENKIFINLSEKDVNIVKEKKSIKVFHQLLKRLHLKNNL